MSDEQLPVPDIKRHLDLQRIAEKYTVLKRVLSATIVLLATGIITNAAAWWVAFENDINSCEERNERSAAIRLVWHAVFDELEVQGGDDAMLDRLQVIVDENTLPSEC